MKSNTAQDVETLKMILLLLRTQTNSVMEKVKEFAPATIESRIYVPSVITTLIKEINYLKTIEDLLGKKPIAKL